MAATSPVRTGVPVGPAIGFAIVDVLTWVIELGVGLGCIAGGVAAARTPTASHRRHRAPGRRCRRVHPRRVGTGQLARPIPIAPGRALVRRPVLAEDVPQGIGDLAEGGAGSQGFLHRREQVRRALGRVRRVVSAASTADRSRSERNARTRSTCPSSPPRRCAAARAVAALLLEPVHADHDSFARFDPLLDPERRLVDLVLVEAGLDRGDRTAHAVDLVDQPRCEPLELVGERLHEVRARRADPTVSVTPVSYPMTCCVRRAIVALRSVGSASASSKPFVCRHCVPPSTAARASSAVRTMLFWGCCAVSVAPPVWVWNRSAQLFGIRRAEPLAHDPRPHAPRGPELRDLLEEVHVAREEEDSRGANSSTSSPASMAACT